MAIATARSALVLFVAWACEPLAIAEPPPQRSAQPSATAADSASARLLLSYPSQALGCGVLTEADCKQAEVQSKNDNWQTQLDGNAWAYAKALLAECNMRRTYVALSRRLAVNPSALARLEEAQRKWLALSVDDEKAHFPHIDHGYYGSVLPMCLGLEEEGQSLVRNETLKGSGLCHENPAGLAGEKEAARRADVALNGAYQKVQAAFAKDPKFMAALTRAERTWITYRDAQVAFAASVSGALDGMCAMRELARVTQERTAYLRNWLAPDTEGDACAGSYAPP